MTSGERRLTAIMFTDLVGYTAMAQRDETLALELLHEHREILRGQLEKFRGREIEVVGDAFFVEFPSAVDATLCAIAIQMAMRAHNDTSPAERQILLRIGIHVGDVVHKNGQVLGDGVNIASRIEPLAEPGGICISEHVHMQIQSNIEHPMQSLGEQRLKNIQKPIEVYQIILPWTEDSGALAENGPKESGNSLVVLPFVNMSQDVENEFFSDGITEEIISALSKVEHLSVISRTSAFAFKGKQITLREIGEQLSVRHVMEGSVRKAGNKVRVTAQLVKVADDSYLWSERYDRQLDDIFSIQEEIAKAIVEVLVPTLLSDFDAELTHKRPQDVRAFDEYLRGRFLINKRTEDALFGSIECFDRALEIDGEYALAHAGIADAFNLLSEYGHLPPKEGYVKAREHAERALALDPECAEALAARAYVQGDFERDWRGALELLERTIRINPGYTFARSIYASYQMLLGNFDIAIKDQQIALEQDPLSLAMQRNLGHVLVWARRYDEAIELLERALRLDPEFPGTVILLGLANLYGGADLGKAIEIFEQGRSGVTRRLSVLAALFLGIAHAKSGEASKTEEILGEVRESEPVHDRSFVIGALCLTLGRVEEGFEWLEKAEQERDTAIYYMKVSPTFDAFRDDSRYSRLLEKVGLA